MSVVLQHFPYFSMPSKIAFRPSIADVVRQIEIELMRRLFVVDDNVDFNLSGALRRFLGTFNS